MLDKSVPFLNIIMRRGAEIAAPGEPEVPGGFRFRLYQPGDAAHWGRIEASVLEFDSDAAACAFFQRAYVPYEDELKKRCVFVVNPEGLPVATASAWCTDSTLGHQASLHWVAACPEYQGMGLGKAVVQKALGLFFTLEPGCPVWLHTQTWSHRAIRLYHSLGFQLVKKGTLANRNTREGHLKIYPNDFPAYLEILEGVMGREAVKELENSAEET